MKRYLVVVLLWPWSQSSLSLVEEEDSRSKLRSPSSSSYARDFSNVIRFHVVCDQIVHLRLDRARHHRTRIQKCFRQLTMESHVSASSMFTNRTHCSCLFQYPAISSILVRYPHLARCTFQTYNDLHLGKWQSSQTQRDIY